MPNGYQGDHPVLVGRYSQALKGTELIIILIIIIIIW
jgi:hypothetical protein